jgi:hypothetical protein
MVLIHLLIERFRKPRGAYLTALFRELLKIAVAATLEAFGHFEKWVSKRYSQATPEEIALTVPILSAIEQVSLPLRPPHGITSSEATPVK